jgi:nicotinamidase/pyrazinamidase
MRTVFVDVDTQFDFLFPAGALYVPGAEKIVSNIEALNRLAAARGIPVISTMDAHSENDPEFKRWPPHCIAGTLGQNKAAGTLLEKRALVANHRPLPALGAQQYLVEKQVNDCFTNTNLLPLLDALNADRYLVYGVVSELCVQCAVEGLLRTGRRVELITDAVRHLDEKAAHAMTQALLERGSALTTVSAATRSD